jgi:hypothetical protein
MYNLFKENTDLYKDMSIVREQALNMTKEELKAIHKTDMKKYKAIRSIRDYYLNPQYRERKLQKMREYERANREKLNARKRELTKQRKEAKKAQSECN